MQIFFILVPLVCPPFTILKLYNFSVCAVLFINTLLQDWFLTLTRCRSTKRYNKGSTKIIYLRSIREPFSGGMERLATIIERGHFPISCEFFEIFNDIFFAERLRMTSPSDSLWRDRSSHRRCFIIKGALRNFAKFTGKHLRHSLFFNKVAGLRPATLLEKRLWHRCFSVNFEKFLRTPFIIKHLFKRK